ncbi:sn-glycerol-3-phosphate ABC transporter ATP-binding protein UgpC [soil metagenome]
MDLEILEGERMAIVGPSGSGKSTLLRLIAGLEPLDSGEILIGGRRADHLPPRVRGLAMVLQNQQPYPHLNVFGNLAFGLRARGVGRVEVRQRVAEVAGRLGLADRLDRRPSTLSGGERQRVVLGRALASRPALVLLDEPVSNLDAPLRTAIRADLLDLHRKLGGTLLVVTHDQAEALAIGERIGLMDRGRLVQLGPPQEVYEHPSSAFVAGFLGSPPMNLLPVEVRVDPDSLHLLGLIPGAGWAIPNGKTWTAPLQHNGSGPVLLGLRPEHIRVVDLGEADGMPTVVARIDRLEPLGHETRARANFGPQALSIRLPGPPGVEPGDRLPIRLDLARASWFSPESGRRLEAK